tara:strand:- start:2910 stop:3806 length:897 start_codon:yes stop_codon:yes gene_type:complete
MATGLSLSSSSSLSDMSKIIVAESIDNVEPSAPMMDLVMRYDIEAGSKQINVPIWGRQSAVALTEGVDLSVPQQVTATVVSLTASEHGILSFVSDRLRHENNENVLSAVGTMHGRAVGRLLDSDLLTLLDGFSKSVPGAGSNATFTTIAGAVSYLRTDNNSTFGPAPSRPNAVLHPEQIRRLTQELAGIQAGGTGMPAQTVPEGPSADIISSYWRGNDPVFGVPIYEDGNITRDGSGDSKGGVFAMEALALAMQKEITAEEERDASLRGTEIVTTGTWGESEIVDTWGVEILSATDAV